MKIVLGIQKTIIYRLVMINHDLDAFLKKISFWRENGRGRQAGAKGYRASRPDQKVGSSVELSGQPLSQKKVFENLWHEPPLKMRRWIVCQFFLLNFMILELL